MTTKTIKKTQFAVVYVGAPFGENEFGYVVSKHRTEEAAVAARAKLQSNPKYYGRNSTVKQV